MWEAKTLRGMLNRYEQKISPVRGGCLHGYESTWIFCYIVFLNRVKLTHNILYTPLRMALNMSKPMGPYVNSFYFNQLTLHFVDGCLSKCVIDDCYMFNFWPGDFDVGIRHELLDRVQRSTCFTYYVFSRNITGIYFLEGKNVQLIRHTSVFSTAVVWSVNSCPESQVA